MPNERDGWVANSALWLYRKFTAMAYPSYDCELCVGQEPWRGCYCDYLHMPTPGNQNATWWVRTKQEIGFWGLERIFGERHVREVGWDLDREDRLPW